MRKLLFIILAIFTLMSCHRDEDIPLTEVSVIKDSISVSYHTIGIECHVECSGVYRDVIMEIASDTSFIDTIKANIIKKNDSDHTYMVSTDRLEHNKLYYMRFKVSDGISSIKTETDTFRTLDYSVPKIKIDSISSITENSAIAHAIILFNGGDSIKETGFCYAKTPMPTIDSTVVKSIFTTKEIQLVALSNLLGKSTYYVRAYAINSKGVGYSKDYTFTTLSLPEVRTGEINDISLSSARVSAAVIYDGNPKYTERGVCWSITTSPTTSDSHLATTSGSADYSVVLSNLYAETQYYVRAYAISKIGIAYGESVSFKTKAPTIPVVTTTAISNITYTTAECSGSVTDNGGAEVTERGFCYGTTANPVISNGKIAVGSGTGSFTGTLSGLVNGTTYYVRAYATNSKGTAYGTQKVFTTTAYAVPTVTTGSVSNITYTSVSVSGNVTSDGGVSVIERGFCYGTTANPVISNGKIAAGSGTGSFTGTLSGLVNGTTYYVRAYATNSKGTAYGTQKVFTTTAYAVPTITTGSVSNITYTSASVSGNVTSDGGVSVIERGFCYGTTANPTISNSKIAAGSGTGSFTGTLSGLVNGTTYYVRAYATNSKGTAYGTQKMFTTAATPAYLLPVVTTDSVTNIYYTSAKVHGNITSDGGSAIVEHGFCYSTTSSPTINDSKIINETDTGIFTNSITGLLDGTTYYVRAYATNSDGISYGETLSFTTAKYDPPQVGTSSGSTTQSTITISGIVRNYGGYLSLSDHGFCYSMSPNPTITDNVISLGEYDQLSHLFSPTFSATIGNLKANTTYYIRAYATNPKGTSYGEEVVIKTLRSVDWVKEGQLPGVFSISENQQVYFSQGNLQYQASTGIWKFADNQYTYSDNNSEPTSTYSGWIDLFGWGTSGWNSGAVAYQPWSTSNNNSDYYPGGSSANDLTGSYVNADWGLYNKISNGGNREGIWRVMTSSEWEFLYSGRPNAALLRSLATVNSVHGYVFLPDKWSLPSGMSFTANANNWTSNVYSASEWQNMESNGAVFLPASGYRIGMSVFFIDMNMHDVGSGGYYWSSSAKDTNEAGEFYFRVGTAEVSNEGRCTGMSVRLVKEVK